MTKKKTELVTNIKVVTDQIEQVEKDIEELRKATDKEERSTNYD